jgi:hypothetical protein
VSPFLPTKVATKVSTKTRVGVPVFGVISVNGTFNLNSSVRWKLGAERCALGVRRFMARMRAPRSLRASMSRVGTDSTPSLISPRIMGTRWTSARLRRAAQSSRSVGPNASLPTNEEGGSMLPEGTGARIGREGPQNTLIHTDLCQSVSICGQELRRRLDTVSRNAWSVVIRANS